MNIDYDIVPDSTAFLVAAVLLAFATEYLVTQGWKSFHPLPASKGGTGDETLGLQATFLFGAVKSIQISARVYLVLLVLEHVLERFPYLDQFRTDEKGSSVQIHKAAPGVALTVWMGMTLCTVKRIIFLQMVSGRKLGRMVLVDRLVDFVVFLIMGTNILEILNLDVSVGLQSVLSAGGIGALMFSLASKDFAENIIGGISLNAWDAVNVGDKVRIGNGIEGTIMEIGLLETIIQGYDDIVTRIPNAQLTRTRISNLSRVKKSRVKQNLRFKYRDLDSIPQVLEEIKQEIRLSCPELIGTETKGVTAVLTEYKADHIEGTVSAHFAIPPATAEFSVNRMDFMLAIARAMKKHDMEFALPSIIYCGETPPLAIK